MAADKKMMNRKKNSKIDISQVDYGKVPPQAVELEQKVLGALMIERNAFAMVSDIISADCFYKDTHQKIYRSIVELASNDEPIDMYTVVEQLKKDENLEVVGGQYYIATLTSQVASAAHLKYHAKIIAQKYVARELIRVTTEIQSKSFEEVEDVDDLLQEAEGQLYQISQRNMKSDYTQIDTVIDDAITRIQDASKNKGSLTGIRTGFTELDKMTAGWQRSDLVIIAARPAMGKTAFVLSMAKNMAVDFNIPVAVFSLEMANVQLVNRLIVNVCNIPGDKIRSGQMEDYDWKALDSSIGKLKGAPIYVDDTSALSVLELRTKARRLVKEHGVQIIIIDYLQLMNAQGMNFFSREQEVSIISRSLKGLAKELDVPILALSQLNRGVEKRDQAEGKKPQLSDLRESGAIEQDADMVCFIHRPEYYDLGKTPVEGAEHKDTRGLAQVIIAKHRNGATGDVNLKFEKNYARFANLKDSSHSDTQSVTLGSKANKVASKDTMLPPPPPPPEDFGGSFSSDDSNSVGRSDKNLPF